MEYLKKLESIGLLPFLPKDGKLYKFMSIDSALKVIENSTLMFQNPKLFNDPFEFHENLIDIKPTEEQFLDWLRKQKVTESDLIHYKIKYRRSPKLIEDIFRTTVSQYKESFGVLSLTSRNDNILMWSHYADMHKGICMGFDYYSNSRNHDFILLKVKYESIIKPVSYFEPNNLSGFNWAFTKSKDWEYEREVRAVYIDKNGPQKINLNNITEINFGVHIQDNDKLRIINSIKSKNLKKIDFFDMNKKASNFSLYQSPV